MNILAMAANACRALKAIDLNEINQIGPDSITANFNTIAPHSVRLELLDDYENEEGVAFAPGMYDIEVHLATVTVANGLPAGSNIVAAWPRVNSSNLFAAYTTDPVSDSSFLDPIEDLQLTSFTQDSTYLKGYIYEVSDTNRAFVGWIPFPLDSLQSKASVALSIMTGPGIGGSGDECDLLTHTRTITGDGYFAAVYPNPTNGGVQLFYRFDSPPDQIAINLFSSNGTLIKNTYTGVVQGKELLLTDNIQDLPPGMYFYIARTNSGKIAQKVIKL